MIHTNKLSKSYITVALLTITTLLTPAAMGQKYRNARSHQPTSNRYLVGLEAGMGTTSLNFKSDITDLNNLKFYSTGWNMGLTAGNKALKFRATFGTYSFQKSLSQKIDQKLISVKFNASPVRLFSKFKYFQMYALTGVDYGTFSFTGMTVPKYVDPVAPPAPACCCETNGPPANPGALTIAEDNETENLVESENLSLKKAQINAGLGAEFIMTKRGKYFRMFAEAHYGIPFKEVINNLSLSNTKLSSQLVVNIGVGFGITR